MRVFFLATVFNLFDQHLFSTR